MVSRKKAAGKARRAAKETKAAEVEEGQEQMALEVQMQRLTIDNNLMCRHGFDGDERCREFTTAFQEAFTQCIFADKNIVSSYIAAMKATQEKFATVWKDATNKGLRQAVSCYVADGTQLVLDGNDPGAHAKFIASFAYYFEQCIAIHEKTQPTIKWQQIVELQFTDQHTLVSFFRKRIPCKCLDEKYEKVKSMTKMGKCMNLGCPLPDRMAAKSHMFCCTGCRQVCYCSAECQKVDWPAHKKDCKKLADLKSEFAAKQRVMQKS